MHIFCGCKFVSSVCWFCRAPLLSCYKRSIVHEGPNILRLIAPLFFLLSYSSYRAGDAVRRSEDGGLLPVMAVVRMPHLGCTFLGRGMRWRR